jgi:hypothetical protein
MNKYGIDTFSIEILEEVDDKLLNETEMIFIAEYDVVNNGYNLKEGGDSSCHSEETKRLISERTKEAIAKNIEKFRKYEIIRGLPLHCIRVNIKGSEGVAVNNHPLCKRNSFTVREYGTIESAKEALLEFYEELERNGVPWTPPKKGDKLPRGIRSIKGGYAVQKIHKGKLFYRAFTKNDNPEDSRREAEEHLNQLIESWKISD